MVESDALVLLPFRSVGTLVREKLNHSPGLHIIRDEDEWRRHWAGPPPKGGPYDPPPIDWRTEMCVVVALGVCGSGGYSVLIDSIMLIGGRMTVAACEIRPGPNCITTQGLTEPFHAVATPADPGPARLSRRIAYYDCEA